MKASRKLALAAIAAAAVAAAGRPAGAQAGALEKLRIGEAVRSVSFGGDFRLRDENFDRRSPGASNRNRLRFRLRVTTDIALPQEVLLGLRWGSGTGEQISTNQSLDNLSGQKAIWIDRAYLRWTPKLPEGGKAALAMGRMPNLLWTVYSSDLVWDDDLSPEGIAEGLEWRRGDVAAFANALQAVTDEDAGTGRNQWLFSEQAGFEAALPRGASLRLAAAYHKWSDENRSSFSQFAALAGNRRTGASPGVLVNRFGVGELTGQLAAKPWGRPLALQATLARNFRARGDLAGPPARDGYQAGFILGKAASAGTWELAYFRKYAQTDVTVADVADADFGDGGTNVRGHIFWAAASPCDWLVLKAKMFVTEVIDTQFPPGDNDVNRFQADVVVKF